MVPTLSARASHESSELSFCEAAAASGSVVGVVSGASSTAGRPSSVASGVSPVSSAVAVGVSKSSRGGCGPPTRSGVNADA